jgi:hypothetical protein
MILGPSQFRPASDCTANYRPNLSPERVPNIKKEVIVGEAKFEIVGLEGRPDTNMNWPDDRQSQRQLCQETHLHDKDQPVNAV